MHRYVYYLRGLNMETLVHRGDAICWDQRDDEPRFPDSPIATWRVPNPPGDWDC